jgi:hypothetical protein
LGYYGNPGRGVMFNNAELNQHLLSSSVVQTNSLVIAEWNLNIPTNIKQIGNYRYRPTDQASSYNNIMSSFDINDSGNHYTDATDSDITIDGGYTDNNLPTTLTKTKDKLKMLYSLESCFQQFRPRSGINKASYLPGRYLHSQNINMARRPRYYMPDKNDKFKYWTSLRTEGNAEHGISFLSTGGQYAINDSAPYIVYEEEVPANRVVVKLQTHSGNVDLGPFSNATGTYSDPLYGDANKSVPLRWKVQGLKNNTWIDLVSFTETSLRQDGTPVIKTDGYVELAYGLKIPKKYRDIFIYAETYTSEDFLPDESVNGYSYFIKQSDTDIGYYVIFINGNKETFVPEYGWYLEEDSVDRLTNFVTDTTSPVKFTTTTNSGYKYREFDYVGGLRVVAQTMNKIGATLDLIELSPRLSVNVSDKVTTLNLKKSASDLGSSGLPVGQLLASTGSLSLFDFDDAFSANNSNSILSKYITNHIQFKIYDVTVNLNGYDYIVPIKTMYSEGFPKYEIANKKLTVELRDLFFYFESLTAPQTLFRDASLSAAVSFLLDSIGFSNYAFKRVPGEVDLIIPFFFIPTDRNVAEILQDLARSTQTAMFFDEYNNFICMSKSYMMPTETERTSNVTLSKDLNIIDVSSKNNLVYNNGSINYDTRSIQKTYGSIKQASLVDSDKTWIYKPVLLWEVTGTENTKTSTGQITNQSDYTLSAIPLNSNLSATVPYVKNNIVVDNIMDFGEGVYWISRYNGYFYSNGEIIKYDAVEYSVSGQGNVWISSTQEYSNYFSKISFNGKLYPTGRVKIYSLPKYENFQGVLRLKNGVVEEHGRGQFGTAIVSHNAAISNHWLDSANVRGCDMNSDYLFKTGYGTATGTIAAAGVNSATAQKSGRTNIIKNFLSTTFVDEKTINSIRSTQTGTVQSSAFILSGPSFSAQETPINFLSYVKKPLTDKFKHFGTRMRIVGKVESGLSNSQSAVGNTTYYIVPGTTPDKNINVSGGSGGLAVLLNPETNVGYYFEIIALGSTNLSTNSKANVNNIMFYKVQKDSSSDKAVPIKLWEGLGNIIVDNGLFTGQYRMASEQNPTVYDLAVEYIDIGNVRRFYLYINGVLIKTVDDASPLPTYNNMALFTRGSSKIMFENIYALTTNYSQNTSSVLETPVQSVYGDDSVDVHESFKKYALSGMIQNTYLSGIDPSQPPKYNIYFEEFGTIMRECATFNVKYDKAYPALYAKLSPTFNSLKTYAVSGFRAGSYGAEFMVFNATDTAISLDSSSGNYLRIQGVTFTQQSANKLTVDEFFNKGSDFSDPQFSGSNLVSSPFKVKKQYEGIKLSRMLHGNKDFSLDVPYVQSSDEANSLMSWLTQRIMKPRNSIGLKIFSLPTMQLGDIVKIDYLDNTIDVLDSKDKRYVVYSIDYNRSISGPEMTVYLGEI